MKKSRYEVSLEIDYDLDRGVYANFKPLGDRLRYISSKLLIINRLVSRGEIIVLQQNEYLPSFQNSLDD